MMLFIVNVHCTVEFINQFAFLLFAACTFKMSDFGFSVIDYLPARLYAPVKQSIS